MKKEIEDFEEWDRRRVYYNKIIVVASSLIAIAFVWWIIFIGAIK